MSPKNNATAVSVRIGQTRKCDQKTLDDDRNAPVAAGNTNQGTRSATAAFGDDSDATIESPARKKQNTASSIPRKSASENNCLSARTSINDDVQTLINDFPRDFDVHLNNSAADARNKASRIFIENEEEALLDVIPRTNTAPTKLTAVETASNIIGAVQMMGVEPKTSNPQNARYDNQKTQSAGVISTDQSLTKRSDCRNDHVRNWHLGLGWVGISIFLSLFVFLGMIWSGLVLNERATYQLESLECRERLQQSYQAMGLTIEFEDTGDSDGDQIRNTNDENDISDRFEEHQFYWQELEAQVRYWKKEAKKYQRYGDGFREQCREDLRHLLSEV